jgi:hypothetical protein
MGYRRAWKGDDLRGSGDSHVTVTEGLADKKPFSLQGRGTGSRREPG